MSDRPRDDEPQESGTEPPWPSGSSPGADQPGDRDPRDADANADAGADATVYIPRPERAFTEPEEEFTGHDGGESSDPGEHEPSQEPDSTRPAWLIPLISSIGALLLGLLLGWFLWSGTGDATGDSEELQATIDELTSENAELQDRADELAAELEELESADGDESAQLEELTAENEELTSEIETLTADVDRLTRDNEDLADQVSGLEEQNTELRDRVEEILADIDAAVVSAPDLAGATVGFASSQAAENDWVLVQIPSATDEVAPGTVLSQTPGPGTPMLSGSALVVSVATTPEPAPDPGTEIETVFETSGTGPGTSAPLQLEGGNRHILVYSFDGPGRHTITLVDAEDDPVAQLVDVNGTAEGATGLPLVGSYSLQVETEDDVDWTVRVVTLP